MNNFSFSILGVGAWGPSFRNWQDLQDLMAGKNVEDDGAKGPKPEVIPANERRRAPLPVRLAVEASSQACAMANLEPSSLASVFVSGLGDTQLTDYMCKVLAGENKSLSPTKFHNSVHNAAAGYWTISTDCMQAANSVAGFNESVSLTLMEAVVQAHGEQRPLLLTFYDAPSSPILKELLENEQPFAVSIILTPVASDASVNLTASVEERRVEWPIVDLQGVLAECYQYNPCAKILPVLQFLTGDRTELSMPLSADTALNLSLVDAT
jgi:hypothetical protein